MYNLTITDLTLDELNAIVALLGKDIITTKAEITQKPGRGRPKTVEKATDEVEKEVPPAFLKSKTAVKPEISYLDVKTHTAKLAAISRDTAIGLLKEFDVKTATEIPEPKWGAYIERAKEILNAPKDEELA